MVDCKICSTTTINNNDLCPKCNKRREATQIILKLQDKIDFNGKISNLILFNIGFKDEIHRNHILWTLHDTNVTTKINNEEYQWIKIDDIKKFVEKYDENKGQDFKITENTMRNTQDKCQFCGKTILKSRKKQKLCKDCKKTKKTLKSLKLIKSFGDNLNIDTIIQETSKEDYQVESMIFDLIDNDLIKKIGGKNYQKIPKNIDKYIKDHEEFNKEITKSEGIKKVISTSVTEDKNKSIEETSEDKTKENNIQPKNIPSNNEIFDEFFEKYLVKTDEDWISSQILYKFFNDYALKEYGMEVPTKGVEGFNSILKFRNRKVNGIKNRIHNGRMEYNLKYVPQKESEEITEAIIKEEKTFDVAGVNIEFDRLKEYFNKNVKILDKKVDENDVTRRKIYVNYKKYLSDKYNENINYDDFISLLTKLLLEYDNIQSIVQGAIVHYNLMIINEFDETDETTVTNTDENSFDDKQIKELFDEFFDKSLIITNSIEEGLKLKELYELFNKYVLKKYDLNISEYKLMKFNILLLIKRNKISDIQLKTINKETYYNLQYVPEENNLKINKENLENNEENKTNKMKLNLEKAEEKTNIGMGGFFTANELRKYLKNKNIKEICTDGYVILIYDDIIDKKEYLRLMNFLNNTKEYINKINVNMVIEGQYNINVEYRFKKEKKDINDSSIFGKDVQKEIGSKITINKNVSNNKQNNNSYKTKNRKNKYTLSDHEKYKPENVSYDLFNTLNEKIIALDENITRVILKKVVGYEIKKRFVDVIILNSALRVSLNIPITKIIDSRGICRDMTNKGSWAMGLTEFKLSDMDDMGYAMNLIIQTYYYNKQPRR